MQMDPIVPDSTESQFATSRIMDFLPTGSETEYDEMERQDSSDTCAKTYNYEEGMTCDDAACKEKCNDYCLDAVRLCCCAYDESEGCKFRVPAPEGCANDVNDDRCFHLCGSYCIDPSTYCCGRGFYLEADGTTWRRHAGF